MDRDTLVSQYAEVNQSLIRLWKTKFFEAAEIEGISPALMGVMSLLARKQPMTSSELARGMHITRGAITQFVEALSDLGYITREADPRDRRLQYLRLNKKGMAAVARLEQLRNALITELTSVLSDDELVQLTAINRKLLDSLEQ